MSKVEIFLGCLFIVFVLMASVAITGIIFTLLWNITIPVIFGGPVLSFIEGTALISLIWMIGAAFRAVTTTK